MACHWFRSKADFILPTNGKEPTPNRELNQLIKEDNIEYFYKEFNGGHHWKSETIAKIFSYNFRSKENMFNKVR